MEKFTNNELLEPILFYKNQLKDSFHRNAEDFFDELGKKAGTNIEENKSICAKYYKEENVIKNLKGQNSRKKAGNVFTIIGIVLLIVAGAILIYMGATKKISSGLGIGLGSGLIAGGGGLIFLAIKLRKAIKKLNSIIDEHQKKADKYLKEAYASMNSLNSLFEWNMAARLFTKTTPLIQLDETFDPEKYQYLHDKYGYNEYTKGDVSTVYVQSGSILGNPFVFEKNYCQSMRDHVYTGTRVITYTVVVSDGKGGTRTEVRHQTLVAHYTAPEPYYYLDTWLIYGNESAPRLSFSRYPTDINSMSENQINHYIKGFDKKLDKMVKKDVGKDGGFTRLHNEEFEALFNALDRDNETEFRLLFTPLGQKNMISLLRGKDIGFGDDFIFKKRKTLNFIKSSHMQFSNSLDRDPQTLMHFDYEECKRIFVDYADTYLKDVYFDLAPLISIPEYQQHKSHEYIYEKGFKRKTTNAEVESAANSHDIKYFEHPDTRSSGVILKSVYLSSEGDSDICNIDAYSFSGTDMVQFVPVMGGDGHLHDVPVKWIKYDPIMKTTPFIVNNTKDDIEAYNKAKSEGKFDKVINNYGNSSAILFKKRLMSFIPKNK